jgi:hypothetical protein
MEERLVRPPKGVTLNPLSMRVFDLLSQFTAFPWPLLKTQAERIDCDPANLGLASLELLIAPLGKGVARFNTPEAGQAVQQALRRMLTP